jgi:hypothetical protein
MKRTRILKLAAFAALLMAFVITAGGDFAHNYRAHRLLLVFGFGAAIALWTGRQQISMFRPTTLAPIAILFGSLVMMWSFAMLLFTAVGK